MASPILEPFLLSVFLAIVCGGPLTWLRRKGVPRMLSLMIVLVTITGMAFLLAALVAYLPKGLGGVLTNTFLILLLMMFVLFEATTNPAKVLSTSADPTRSMETIARFISGSPTLDRSWPPCRLSFLRCCNSE